MCVTGKTLMARLEWTMLWLSSHKSPIVVQSACQQSHLYITSYQLQCIRSPIIVTIWNVVFANKSRKLGWIWMKLGRWGWGLKRLSLARFQQNHAMGFGESTKKWVAEALFFVRSTTHHICHFPCIDFRQTSHEHVSRWWFATHGFIFQKSFHWGVEFAEKPYFSLGYPVCAQPTGHGKWSAAPALFPSPSGHPTDVPFLGDFCWGMYRFPPILRKCPYQQWTYLDGDTVAPPGERWDTTQ